MLQVVISYGENFVAWCWKAMVTAVQIMMELLTTQVSANKQAGFQ